MKKFFKFLGILVLIIIVIVVIAGLITPKDVTVERSTTIKGDASVVREQMFNYNNYKNWNPWDDKDSTMKWSVTEDGKKYSWEGGKETGKGEMMTTAEDATTKSIDLHFIEPFEDNPKVMYKVEDMGNGEVKATTVFKMHNGFPKNGIMMMMRMEKMLATSFDKGLSDLKAYVESGKAGAAPAAAINIQEVAYPGGTYAVIRKTIGWGDMAKFFPETYGALGQAAGARITGPSMAFFYKWDDVNMQTDVAAGFPVSGTEAVKGATMVTQPASAAYMVVYTGGQSGSIKVHKAIGKHLEANKKEMNVVFEEYITSYNKEPDTNKHVTNIYYLLK